MPRATPPTTGDASAEPTPVGRPDVRPDAPEIESPEIESIMLQAEASVRIEGGVVSAPARDLVRRFLAGEIDRAAYETALITLARTPGASRPR